MAIFDFYCVFFSWFISITHQILRFLSSKYLSPPLPLHSYICLMGGMNHFISEYCSDNLLGLHSFLPISQWIPPQGQFRSPNINEMLRNGQCQSICLWNKSNFKILFFTRNSIINSCTSQLHPAILQEYSHCAMGPLMCNFSRSWLRALS